MNILHAVQPYDGGGVSIVIVNLLREFRKHCINQYIITARCSKYCLNNHFEAVRKNNLNLIRLETLTNYIARWLS